MPSIRNAALCAALAAVSTSAAAAPAPGWAGTWRNEANSVRIRAARCGAGMCGTVVWASDKARADAARGGTDKLVGTQIFRDFRPGEDGKWQGKVFVPDINASLSGTLSLSDRDTLVGEGCLFHRVGCRTQTWKRVR